MVRHQLYSHLKIVDGCSFQVTRFDMLSGSSDIIFWGVVSLNFSDLTSGFHISGQCLNQTAYKNTSLSVQLLPYITWDQINILSIWDIASTSSFGHVTLPQNGSDSVSDSVHTVFGNCKNLSDNYRFWWNLNVEENWIEIWLKAATPTTYYMAFGWANLNRTKDLISEADVTMVSFTEECRPFIDDFYITAYSECKFSSKDHTAIGVCPDVVYENSKNGMMENNTRQGMMLHCILLRILWLGMLHEGMQVRLFILEGQKRKERRWDGKFQVVDGALSYMYNNNVLVDDQQVTFFWTLSEDSITIAARGVKKSGYLAIGFGNGMVNSYAYMGWIGDTGKGHLNTYWIDGKRPSNIHPTNANLTHVRCMSEDDIITLEFTRPLKPSCNQNDKPKCKNIVDPTTPLKVIWAMGSKWTNEHLSEKNMHTVTSQRPLQVLLIRGYSEAEQGLQSVFMMFLTWGILIPGGILAARYLKQLPKFGVSMSARYMLSLYRERQQRDRLQGRSNWVLGNVEEEDSIDLLIPNDASARNGSQSSGVIEVQLERKDEKTMKVRRKREKVRALKGLSQLAKIFIRHLYAKGYFKEAGFVEDNKLDFGYFENSYGRDFIKFAAYHFGKDHQDIAK
ncbi:cytochrome b561, DM13 and DOMON domain-containing protein [Gossypium australe]|uniref:Cytochrome b561, DM13 and DOMON domain-containing protein n=1 Tax=Gossypium australe TaxID=47621 RepID=A0A5B6VSX0_9ROSI|nr:cytochrome b561, DM13 and DOMON domain-containing protein [Gossypium australe]